VPQAKGLGENQMKINEPMRQFLIDRAQTLYYEALHFPKTRRVAVNWICQALRLARRAGDMELYRQIAHKDAHCGAKNRKGSLISQGKKNGA